MKDFKALANLLRKLDGKNYTAYKDIRDTYLFLDFTLIIDYIQGDPFASPSRVRVQIPQNIAGFPNDTYYTKSREIALRDYLCRQLKKVLGGLHPGHGTGKSGDISIPQIGQELLERSTVIVNDQLVEARLSVGMPAKGRRILGLQAVEMLCEEIPKIVNKCLKYAALDSQALYHHIKTAEDADYIRKKLIQQNLIAFVGNDSVLPRRSGVDQRPLQSNVTMFKSPESMEVSFNCPNFGEKRGLGIKSGITLIVGGGYHGKSTLLNAISRGVYNHIPGDGREWVITNTNAIKIKAEDGRNVQKVDISPFIQDLPNGISTKEFSTPNASGSTSQATNIMESLEIGAKTLLLDEDTSATNFMIRDHRMQQLISKDKEPITPFIDKVKSLYTDLGVSTILVMGGSGDYFDVADSVIGLHDFHTIDMTDQAKKVALENPNNRLGEGGASFGSVSKRRIFLKSLDPSRGKKNISIKTKRTDSIGFGREEIDLASVEQLVDNGQLKAIVEGIFFIKKDPQSRELSLAEILNKLDQHIKEHGIHSINSTHKGDLVGFRPYEIGAAINRHRGLIVLD